MYIDLVELYLLFSRACHTNDLELFIFCLGKMCVVFFATSRPNYARWMTKYHLDLLNIDETHPGARAMLEAGALTVRRTTTVIDLITAPAHISAQSSNLVVFRLQQVYFYLLLYKTYLVGTHLNSNEYQQYMFL